MANHDVMARKCAPVEVIRALIAIIMIGAPGIALGQGTGSKQASIETAVSAGTDVTVETRGGKTFKGRVSAVSPTRLELLNETHREIIPVAEISRVRERYQDRSGDGAKRGAVVGLVGGLVFGMIGGMSTCGDDTARIDAPPSFGGAPSFCSAGMLFAGAAVFGGIGAGIGAGIGVAADAMRSASRDVWPEPGASRGIAATTAPRSAAVTVVMRW